MEGVKAFQLIMRLYQKKKSIPMAIMKHLLLSMAEKYKGLKSVGYN